MGRQVAEQVAQLVGSFRIAESGREKVPQSNTSVPYRGLDYDSLRALRAYIFNEETGAHVEEEALLDRLERVWRECVRADSEKLLEDLASFVVRERAFLTWIELKRHMAAFERAEKRMSTYQSLRTTYWLYAGWATEGTTIAEVERRQQQYQTLMGATETILISFEDIGQGFGLGPNVEIDKDELLRQAIVVLAGPKHAVEMQWKNIEFSSTVRLLADALEDFRKGEEEDNRATLLYVH
jgi:hypothetical protein